AIPSVFQPENEFPQILAARNNSRQRHWRDVLPELIGYGFPDTATTEIYTLSLHDALPICRSGRACSPRGPRRPRSPRCPGDHGGDRKSTRLNSSHVASSYAVFCWKKKTQRCTIAADGPE